MLGLKRNGKKNGKQALKSDYLIELRDVDKIYRSSAGEFHALRDVDLQIDGSEFVAVIGKSVAANPPLSI